MSNNFLKSSRQEIKLQLTPLAEQVYETIPARVNAPCFIVSPGSPYVEEGETFTDFAVRFEVVALAGVATNEVISEELDTLIINALDALDTWGIEGVDTPSQFEINGANYLGTRINVVAEKSL